MIWHIGIALRRELTHLKKEHEKAVREQLELKLREANPLERLKEIK